jgi:serine/threonine protein kinase
LNNPIANKIRAAHGRKGIFQDKWIYRGKNLNNLDVKNDPNRGMQNTRNLVFNFLKEIFVNNKHQNSELTNSLGVLLQNFNLLDTNIINDLYAAKNASSDGKIINSIKNAALKVKWQLVRTSLEDLHKKGGKDIKESIEVLAQNQNLLNEEIINELYLTSTNNIPLKSVQELFVKCVLNSASKIKKQVVTSFLDENIGKDLPRQIKNAIQVLSRNKDSLNRESINKLYLLCSKDLRKESNKEMLIDYILNEAEQINKVKFARENKALNAKNNAKNFRGIRKGALLGKGGLGAVYELNNDKDYVIKVPHIKNYNQLNRVNREASEEFSKAEKLRGIIEKYIKNYNFAGAQGLENAAAPVLITQAQVGFNKINELVMPKAEGKDGDKFIFGDPEKGKAPIGIYGNKVGYNNFTITSRRAALSIALQKAMILRALNDGGYANIDTKLENIMISEDGKVSMIDLGSVVKQGDRINVYTRFSRAPEVDFGRPAGPEADVFSDAIDRPYVLFGSIANKYLPRGQIHAKLFTSYEHATDRNVQAKKREYLESGFKEPTFPEYFTNAQKMRYMYYHLGFLKIQKETGEIYPPEVLDSLAKLQALSTEPDPEKRISERVVEDVLLNLMASIDQWKEPGIYRIEGEKITPGSMTDEILPKNKSDNKENIQQNNKNRGNLVKNKRQDNDSAVWMICQKINQTIRRIYSKIIKIVGTSWESRGK